METGCTRTCEEHSKAASSASGSVSRACFARKGKFVYTSRIVRVILAQGPCYLLCIVPMLTDDPQRESISRACLGAALGPGQVQRAKGSLRGKGLESRQSPKRQLFKYIYIYI